MNNEDLDCALIGGGGQRRIERMSVKGMLIMKRAKVYYELNIEVFCSLILGSSVKKKKKNVVELKFLAETKPTETGFDFQLQPLKDIGAKG
ncbi:Hypothetical predicted protein [Octopus vulgaris]|uniref:Uncharacterized protein n=1 Tax=Octopus vulgaris TaxID=6645 RepID=A0AA36EZF7_OCTVU|nr:Hypothetical predicted protein [Octopus vulgaris]